MPTYEYKREDGSTFEISQKMSDAPLEVCPETGQKVKRILSGGGGVVFKGDGFYITDYKNAGKKNEDSDKTQPSDERKSESTSSEEKSE